MQTRSAFLFLAALAAGLAHVSCGGKALLDGSSGGSGARGTAGDAPTVAGSMSAQPPLPSSVAGSGGRANGGVCVSPCASGQAACAGTCVDTSRDPKNCGRSRQPRAASGMAADAADIDWVSSSAGEVKRIAKSGGQPIMLASGQGLPLGIAVDATDVYWTAFNDQTVMKVAKGGGRPTTLASGQAGVRSIAVDAPSIYWLNYSGGTVMKLAK